MLLLAASRCFARAEDPYDEVNSSATTVHTEDPYEYSCIGNCDSPRQTDGKGGICMGGGGDKVLPNFPWMAEQSGGGDFLVLRASGTVDADNSIIYGQGGHNSVATLLLKSRDASELPFVLGKIRGASAIWFAGGNQWTYMNYWRGTSVQAEVQAAVDRGIPVGGTSAGDAVLTGFVVGGVTSEKALADPYDPAVRIEDAFLHLPFIGPLPAGRHHHHARHAVFTDQHFFERDRLGRSLVFLARIRADGRVPAHVPVRAVCIDRQTSLWVDPVSGAATIVGDDRSSYVGTVYLLSAHGAPSVIEKGKPLSFAGIDAYRLTVGKNNSFDLAAWKGEGGVAYRIDVNDGRIDAPGSGYGP